MSKKSKQAARNGGKLVAGIEATPVQRSEAVAEVMEGVAPKAALTAVGITPSASDLEGVQRGAIESMDDGMSPDEVRAEGKAQTMPGGDIGANGEAAAEAQLEQMLGLPTGALGGDGEGDATDIVPVKAVHVAKPHVAAHKPVTAKGNDLLAMAAAFIPTTGNALDQPVQIGNGVFAQMKGDVLTLAIPVTKRMRDAAKPSGENGDGALCLTANTGGFKALGLADYRVSVMLGFPNPNKAVKSKQHVRTR